MRERIIIVGAGGQGVMLLGKIIALAGLREGKEVSWIPAYGAEVRGGAAYCMVIISDEEIALPMVEKADTLILMNEPSFRKFKEKIDAQGLIIINASLIKAQAPSITKNNSKIKRVRGPFTDIACQLGNIKVANMVALGVYIAKKKIISLNTVFKVIEEIAPADKRGLIEINRKALSCGLKIK